MKKKIYFSVMTLSAILLASCSQDNVYLGSEPDNGGQVIDNVEMSNMPIQFSAPGMLTKGSGVVDNIDGTIDWGNRTVRVYAVTKGGMPDDLSDRAKAPLLTGVDVSPKNAVEGVITVKDNNETYYYPRKGAFDFYAFYVDDAATLNGGSLEDAVEYDNKTNSYFVPFEIDGTQDLMMAKAEANKEVTDYSQNLLFSAQSARDGYRPKLTLEHQLARLSFYVVWGDEKVGGSNASDEVFVKSLEVNGVNTTGKMHFMAVEDANRTILWDNSNADLPIMELDENGDSQPLNSDLKTDVDIENCKTKNDLITAIEGKGYTIEDVLGKYHVTKEGDTKNETLVGTPIMVEPKSGADGYVVDLTLVQYYDKEGNLIPETQRETVYDPITVKLADGTDFEAGKNYKIKLKANSLEIIQVEVDVRPWEDGGEVVIDPDL